MTQILLIASSWTRRILIKARDPQVLKVLDGLETRHYERFNLLHFFSRSAYLIICQPTEVLTALRVSSVEMQAIEFIGVKPLCSL